MESDFAMASQSLKKENECAIDRAIGRGMNNYGTCIFNVYRKTASTFCISPLNGYYDA